MNRQRFGNLVASLRKEQRNEFDEVMSQYDLAKKASIPLVSIQKIEQGRQANLKSQTLLLLMRALNLSSRGREAFLLCASGIMESEFVADTLAAEQNLEKMRCILSQLQTPGFVTDCFGDVLFITPSLLVVYNSTPEQFSAPHLLTQFNIIRLIVAEEFSDQQAMMGENLHNFVRRTVLIYKAMTIKYRSHWYFQMILPELNRYPLFREHWQSPIFHDEDVSTNTNTLQVKHPFYGDLKFLSGPIQTLTTHGDLNLYSLQPLDAHTAKTCEQVAQKVDTAPIPLATWPKKQSANL